MNLTPQAIPPTYEISRVMDRSDTYEKLSVTTSAGVEPIMRGENYISNDVDVYSFCWPTNCAVSVFFAALDDILPMQKDGAEKTSTTALKIVPFDALENNIPQGVIIFTDIGPFFAPLATIFEPLAVGSLGVEDLEKAIATSLDDKSISLEIKALRLTTESGDFQIDVIPDMDCEREVFVITHNDLAPEITALYEATSGVSVNAPSLSTALKQVTSICPRPTLAGAIATHAA